MSSSNKKIGVVYLNRKAEGEAPVRRFIESYQAHDAGVAHEFITLYKGFDQSELNTSKLLFEGIEHRQVRVGDDMTDIDAYLIAAQSLSDIDTFCFLNTFSEIACDNWLRNLFNAVSRGDTGIAGATGSYESLLNSFRLNFKVIWMIQHGILKYDPDLDRQYYALIQKNLRSNPNLEWSPRKSGETSAQSPPTKSNDYSHIHAHEAAFEEYWKTLTAEGAVYSFLGNIPAFPNPSIRTNAFIVGKEHLVPFFSGPGQRNKLDSFLFESGANGLTHSILKKGLRAVLVNNSGDLFDVPEWPRSQTFRLGNQEKLMIHDNQTRHFEQLAHPERDVLAYMSWGSCLNYPPDRVFTFGIPFSMDKPTDKPDENRERDARRVYLLYAHILKRPPDPEGFKHFSEKCRTIPGSYRSWWHIGNSAESKEKLFFVFRMAETLIVLTWTLLWPLPAKAYRFTVGRLKYDLQPSIYFARLLGSELQFGVSNLFSEKQKIPIEKARSIFEDKTIAVVYLARGASQEDLISIERFFASYTAYEAGLRHHLYVIYKGFGSESEKDRTRRSISIPHTALDFEDNHLDVGAFVQAGRLVNEDYVLFLNTHSEFRADHWLSKLVLPLRDDKKGMVGCTGSFESLNPLDARFPPSPNPHLRSNAIMIDRRIFSEITKDDKINSKLDAWLFESGPNSLTNRVEALGKSCVVVDRDGATYEMSSWQRSGVFRNIFRNNALIIDNQFRSFKSLPLSQKLILSSSAWKFDPQNSDALLGRRKLVTDCVVVIPTHKPDMSDLEELSFKNTLKVLSDRDIHVLLPAEVDPSLYKSISKDVGKDITVMNLPGGFMGSTEKYNFMGLSHEFYKIFERYKYVLVCHLDAWVFRDELKYWVNLGYDYVGAPLFLPEPQRYASLDFLMAPGGGNGGLCLRRTEKMLELTREVRVKPNYVLFIKAIWFLLKNRRFDLCKIFLRICRGILRDHRAFQKKHNVYEDVMISILYALLDRTLRVAPPDLAYKFALEVNMGEITNTKLKLKLPLGIHGYDKYISPVEFRTLLARQDIPYSNRFNAIEKKGYRVPETPLMTVVTVIKNIYRNNRVETLRQCIESVREQSYARIEHLIIDGASDDGTLEFISEYVKKGWVKLHSSPDAGVWDAMNKGLKLSSGDFVNFLNSDDYFCDVNAIQIAVDLIRKQKADWFFSGATVMKLDGTSYIFPTSLYGVFSCFGIVHQTMFVRSDILKAANPFESLHVTKENYLMMMLILNGIRHAYYPDSLVHYREGGFSTSAYGGENTELTRSDFGQYFYHLAGKRWGLTLEDCCEMSGWRVFGSKGVKRSFRIGLKLRLWDLKIDYMKRLFGFINLHRNPMGVAARRLKRALGFTGDRDKLRNDLASISSERDKLRSDLALARMEREELRSDFSAFVEKKDKSSFIVRHANLHPFNYVAGFDSSSPENALVPFIGRIQRAFSNELNSCEDSPPDVWSHITPGHQEIISLINTDHRKAADYLNRMFITSLSHGFQQGEVAHKSLIDHQSSRDWMAQFTLDKLCGLAEALGCVAVENPEQGSWGALMSREPDELLALISDQLGFELIAPSFQAGAYGLKTSRGLFTERECYSILIANTVSQLISDKNAPICEIGGGGGSLAFYLWQFGFRNITVIDLPTVNIAQAYWLHRNLPDCEIVLTGEKNPFEELPGIRVLSTRYFEQAPTLHFGLVVNVDSFPEIAAEVVKSYLRQMRKNARLFLSINQEASERVGIKELTQLIVHKYTDLVGGFHRKYRYPFWLRNGYVEEAYEIEPYRDVTRK